MICENKSVSGWTNLGSVSYPVAGTYIVYSMIVCNQNKSGCCFAVDLSILGSCAQWRSTGDYTTMKFFNGIAYRAANATENIRVFTTSAATITLYHYAYLLNT